VDAGDAETLAALAGEPLVDLRYRVADTDITISVADFAPFLVCQFGADKKLLPGTAITLLAADILERLQTLQVLSVEPHVAGTLAATLLAAAGRS
jgi:hypothetical protein